MEPGWNQEQAIAARKPLIAGRRLAFLRLDKCENVNDIEIVFQLLF
jgi:hypothetical protein